MRNLAKNSWIAGVIVAAALIAPSSALAFREPVIGCDSHRYTYAPNHFAWLYAPANWCELGGPLGPLGGIENARWHYWGRSVARGSGYLIDGLGFRYPARLSAYGLVARRLTPGSQVVRYYRWVHAYTEEEEERGGAWRGPFNVLFNATAGV
jgi:hypothetical protein